MPSNPAPGDQGHAGADEDGAGPAQGRDGFIEKIYGQKHGKDVAQAVRGRTKLRSDQERTATPEEEETSQKQMPIIMDGLEKTLVPNLVSRGGGIGLNRADSFHAVGQEHVSQRNQDYGDGQDR